MRIIKLCSCLFLTINFFLCSFSYAIDKEKLKEFFKEYDTSDEKKNWHWDRLPYAIEKGYPDVAEFLILHGDSINNYREWEDNPPTRTFEYYIRHPLISAIRKNYDTLAILIIQSIKDLNKVGEIKINNYNHILPLQIPLQIAIEEGCNDIVLALLLSGADANKQYSSYIGNFPDGTHKLFTPLKEAITLKKIGIVQLLLDNNASVEFCGANNITPLYMAVEDNYIEGVKLLLNYDADPLRPLPGDHLKKTPLELAMQKEYWDIVDLLLEAATSRV